MKFSMLRIDQILENPLNRRSMDDAAITNLMQSIRQSGLLTPLTVYKNEEDEENDTYILVSGHRRLAALKKAGRSGSSKVQCTIIDHPVNPASEEEMLARANVHRSSPEEIRTEVRIVNDIWKFRLSAEEKERWTGVFRKRFEEKHKNDPKYLADPAKYTTNQFRPRLDYINQVTGLDLSNRTVTALLKKTCEEEMEPLAEGKKARKPKALSKKDVERAIDTLDGILDAYPYKFGKPPEIEELQTKIVAVQTYLNQVERL